MCCELPDSVDSGSAEPVGQGAFLHFHVTPNNSVVLVKIKIGLDDYLGVFLCFFFFCLLFTGSVKRLARDGDTSCVKLFWNGQQPCQTFWQNVVVGLLILGPPLKTVILLPGVCCMRHGKVLL